MGCGGEVGVHGCVMFGHVCRTRHLWGLDRDCRGNGASILILSSTPPGFSGLRGGGMLPPGEGDGGAGAIAATAPPSADLHRGGVGWWEIPQIPWRQGLIPRVLSISGEAG